MHTTQYTFFKKSILMLSVALLTCSVPVSFAVARGCDNAPGVQLSAQARQEVDNDMIRMTWMLQFERKTASEAMTAVSEVLTRQLPILKARSEIKNLQSNIQTSPRYGKDQTVMGWEATGTLRFEMPLSALQANGNLGLSAPLALSGIQYFVSGKVLESTRHTLLDEAMKTFQLKASQVASGFGQKSYELGELNVNDDMTSVPRPMLQDRMYAAEASSMAKTAVPVEAGNSEVSVSINGNVCLK